MIDLITLAAGGILQNIFVALLHNRSGKGLCAGSGIGG